MSSHVKPRLPVWKEAPPPRDKPPTPYPKGSYNTWKLALFWIWAEAEPNATIIAASIPVLRDLVRNLCSGRGPSTYSSGQYIRSDTLSKFQAPSNANHSR
ncbi:hypothetical protein BN1723_013407 [Verticillium longisporum]|uniref:Uncharacterized protein n=1 Tax=Verticillium longisporum TaxID=100787 RepID=A0A0G4LTH5_VERLO|nr:hypothetical protein BN1723_013407 [Verticillium longisporum]